MYGIYYIYICYHKSACMHGARALSNIKSAVCAAGHIHVHHLYIYVIFEYIYEYAVHICICRCGNVYTLSPSERTIYNIRITKVASIKLRAHSRRAIAWRAGREKVRDMMCIVRASAHCINLPPHTHTHTYLQLVCVCAFRV